MSMETRWLPETVCGNACGGVSPAPRILHSAPRGTGVLSQEHQNSPRLRVEGPGGAGDACSCVSPARGSAPPGQSSSSLCPRGRSRAVLMVTAQPLLPGVKQGIPWTPLEWRHVAVLNSRRFRCPCPCRTQGLRRGEAPWRTGTELGLAVHGGWTSLPSTLPFPRR